MPGITSPMNFNPGVSGTPPGPYQGGGGASGPGLFNPNQVYNQASPFRQKPNSPMAPGQFMEPVFMGDPTNERDVMEYQRELARAQQNYQNQMNTYRGQMENSQLQGSLYDAWQQQQQAAGRQRQWEQKKPERPGVGGSGDYTALLNSWYAQQPVGP